MYLIHLIPIVLSGKFYHTVLYPKLAGTWNIYPATNLYAPAVILLITWTSLLIHRHLEKPMVNGLRRIFLGDGGVKAILSV